MEDLLIKIGLTNEEAKTYIATLSLGPSTIYLISQKSGIPRSTTYLLIEQLKLKGLISQIEHGKKTIFTPASPDKLKDIIEEKQDEIVKLKNSLQNTLPQLNSLHNSMPQKPKVSYFEGIEGIKNIFEDSLYATEILVLCSGYEKPMDKKVDDYQETYFAKCDLRKIKTKELVGGAPGTKEYIEKYNGKMHEIRLYPFKKGLEHIDKMIYGNKLAIISYEYVNGVVIENSPIVEFEKELFMKLWK